MHVGSIFHDVKRVLKRTGSLYLNIGDTYQDKNLLGIPERLLSTLVSDGWVLRNKIIWYKRNHMPSSVKDRYANSYEPVYFLTKSKNYFFDLDAVRVPHTSKDRRAEKGRVPKVSGKSTTNQYSINATGYHHNGKNPGDVWQVSPQQGRTRGWASIAGHPFAHNKKYDYGGDDFWDITTRSFKGTHFATFPPSLVERPIRASCPVRICIKCGRARVVRTEGGRPVFNIRARDVAKGRIKFRDRRASEKELREDKGVHVPPEKVTVEECSCGEGFLPGVVLDPFAGSGTVAYVAQMLGRDSISIEIKPEYVSLIKNRLESGSFLTKNV